MDNIIEIIYKGEDYLNDGITDFKNNQNNLKDLDEPCGWTHAALQ